MLRLICLSLSAGKLFVSGVAEKTTFFNVNYSKIKKGKIRVMQQRICFAPGLLGSQHA